ncbi:hypothetical protein DSD19_04850 [Rhodovulum sp. BSW8]|uniref:Rop-like protein n=1 Tax=Rhodovulum visakhapatnamense TaxID=364297 RepID=A0A4R8G711_9RHOB|nr:MULTISPECIES: CCE_0567 family metalloprotein [Rhodovulum]OLS44986.1 hypothetical protein BV509_11975 [Rhodovulum sulfidophilum]MBL3570248.1 hypothetical protein [Rhodovulum visakhapatnamense]MBL3578961.1 hypothetical protein [Rhodovulum visakhapatnamense]RBO54706.1 hypothetical protein DSD19_04850 [Rhodovulum sp. BSW8]TDX32615.1 hypothetical protein EV657_103187 [Rhodovulum visakhapatnamense]
MSLEELEAKVRKLSMRATNAKMNLHDLAEELPVDWTRIPEVAAETHQVFKDLEDARNALKAARKAAEEA